MRNADSAVTGDVSSRESRAPSILARDLRWAQAQKALGHLFFIPFAGSLILTMKWYFRYDFVELKTYRRYFRELTNDKTPLLICPNHLTYLDSVMLIYLFGNHWWYLFNFRRLSWNLPAIEYQNTFFFRMVGLMSKCIFINRGGSRRHHQRILDTSRALLERSEVFTIFPEGRRSRTGRFDDRKLAYGIGKIVSGMKECRVLCAYLRPMDQKEHGSFPKRRSRIRLETKLLHFRPDGSDNDAVRSIVRTIADEVMALEQKVLATES